MLTLIPGGEKPLSKHVSKKLAPAQEGDKLFSQAVLLVEQTWQQVVIGGPAPLAVIYDLEESCKRLRDVVEHIEHVRDILDDGKGLRKRTPSISNARCPDDTQKPKRARKRSGTDS